MTFPTELQALEFLELHNLATSRVVVIPTTHNHWVITDSKEAARPAKLCSICGEPFPEFSNNALPINDGRCCAYCDDHVVTPARIEVRR